MTMATWRATHNAPDWRKLVSRVSFVLVLTILFTLSLFGTNLPGSRVAITSGMIIGLIGPILWLNAMSVDPHAPIRLAWADFAVLAFISVGLVGVLISGLRILPDDPLRPYRDTFLLRHSFHFFVLGPTMLGAFLMLSRSLDLVLRFGARYGLLAYAALGITDLTTGYLWGDPQGMLNEGYVAFLDPSTTTMLCSATYFLHVASTGRRLGPLLIALAFFVATQLLDYGMMYNTMTGKFIFIIQLGFTLTIRRPPIFPLAVALLVCAAVVAALMIGIVFPGVGEKDLNSIWRFMVWRENIATLFLRGGLGVGFGTPYYGFTDNNLISVFRLVTTNEFANYKYSSAFDVFYVRAQHSTIVNTFYRAGLIGGVALLWMYAAPVIWSAKRLLSGAGGPLLLAATVLFLIEATQTALHVGLESPRYFLFFCLSWALLRAALHQEDGDISRSVKLPRER